MDASRLRAPAAAQAVNRRVVVAHTGTGVLLPAIAESVGAATAVWLAVYVPTTATPPTQQWALGLPARRGA